MPEIKSQENQQELFTEFSPSPKKSERLPGIQKTSRPVLISTNLEQMLIVGILFILLACFIFFMGVLRGKAIAVEPGAPVVAQTVPATPRAQALPAAQVSTLPSRPVVVTPVTAPVAKKPERVFNTQPTFEPASSLPPQTGTDLSKPYTIQLVTHKKKEFAEQEVASLRHAGRYSYIIPSGDYFQVCVGQYLNKEAAKKDLKFFSSKYKDCFLRRR